MRGQRPARSCWFLNVFFSLFQGSLRSSLASFVTLTQSQRGADRLQQQRTQHKSSSLPNTFPPPRTTSSQPVWTPATCSIKARAAAQPASRSTQRGLTHRPFPCVHSRHRRRRGFESGGSAASFGVTAGSAGCGRGGTEDMRTQENKEEQDGVINVESCAGPLLVNRPRRSAQAHLWMLATRGDKTRKEHKKNKRPRTRQPIVHECGKESRLPDDSAPPPL